MDGKNGNNYTLAMKYIQRQGQILKEIHYSLLGTDSKVPCVWLLHVRTIVSRPTQSFSSFSKKMVTPILQYLCTVFSKITTNSIQHNIRRNCLCSKIVINDFFINYKEYEQKNDLILTEWDSSDIFQFPQYS